MACVAPTFRPEPGLRGWVNGAFYVLAAIALIVLAWVLSIRCRIRQLLFRARHVHSGNDRPEIDLEFDLDGWLAGQPAVANAIVWHQPGSKTTLLPYPAWTPAQKRELADRFRAVYQDEYDDPLPEAPPGSWHPVANGWSLGDDVAWRMFIAYVAHGLAVEIRQTETAGRLVPWSLTGYTAPQLFTLLDGRSLFTHVAESPHYIVQSSPHGAVVPGDPLRTLTFLREQGLIGESQHETTLRLMEWSRANIVHNLLTPLSYGYPGYPPVERIIAGVVDPESGERKRWAGGCWAMGGFLRHRSRSTRSAAPGFSSGSAARQG